MSVPAQRSGALVPFADDFTMGTPLPQAPAVTLDAGIAAQYTAITGDRMAMPLSDPLSKAVTANPSRLANPGLVMQIAIGQSTVATRRVIANLFYRGVRILKPVHLGDTLTTTVTPRAAILAASGPRAKVLLHMRTEDQDGTTVIDFERVALIPVRDREALVESGDIGVAENEASLMDFERCLPEGWDLAPLPRGGPPTANVPVVDPLREPITDDLAMVRLTGNHAAAHRDPKAGQFGRRLVYGGHVVALAQAALVRQTDCATILGWRSCDHLAAAFPGDVLEISVKRLDNRPVACGAIEGYHVTATAQTGSEPARDVLSWKPVVLVPGPETLD